MRELSAGDRRIVTHPSIESAIAFLVGPPGAGKTTIARAVATQLGVPFHSIDEWVRQVYPPEAHALPMTDAQVDAALALLLGNVGPSNALYEFAYHDYVGLLVHNTYPLFTAARKVVVSASLAVCSARNENRSSPVHHAYVERSWRSTQELIERCASDDLLDTIVVDTTRTSATAAVATISDFLTHARCDHGNPESAVRLGPTCNHHGAG